VEHACYLINRCLRGADGKTPLGRLKGVEGDNPLLEFGEQLWAKPTRIMEWHKRKALDSRWIEATWVGISPRAREPSVVLPDGGAMTRLRTVKRQPVDERWSAESIAEVAAFPRRPEPGKQDGLKVRRMTLENVDVAQDNNAEGTGVMLGEPMAESRKAHITDFRITQAMLDTHGKTVCCLGSAVSGTGDHRMQTAECRQVFETSMEMARR